MRRWILGAAVLLFVGVRPASAFGLEPTDTDARKIAEAMEARDEGDRVRMEVITYADMTKMDTKAFSERWLEQGL